MKLNQLRDNEGARYVFKRIGRGLGSGKGKTAGRGYKGQKSRTGVSINGFEGGQMPLHIRLPKRGFRSLNRKIVQIVNIHMVEEFVSNGKLSASSINKQALYDAGLIRTMQYPVKLLAHGEVSSKFAIEVDYASKAAVSAVADKGGSVSLLASAKA